MSDRVRQRLQRNVVVATVPAKTPSAATGATRPTINPDASDFIPPAIRSYLANHPATFGPVIINLDVRPDRVQHARGFGPVVLAEGWLGLEPWGVWSGGHRAVIYAVSPFPGKDIADGARELVIDARGAISKEHRRQPVRITVGRVSKEFVFVLGEIRTAQLRIPIPDDVAGSPILKIEVELDRPLASPDGNLRGLGISSIAFRPGANVNAT